MRKISSTISAGNRNIRFAEWNSDPQFVNSIFQYFETQGFQNILYSIRMIVFATQFFQVMIFDSHLCFLFADPDKHQQYQMQFTTAISLISKSSSFQHLYGLLIYPHLFQNGWQHLYADHDEKMFCEYQTGLNQALSKKMLVVPDQ